MGDHVVLVHDSERIRQGTLARWVRDGLDGGEQVIYSESDPTEPDRKLAAILRDHSVQVDDALRTGQLLVLPPAAFYPPDGQFALVQEALAAGYEGVRMSTEDATARGHLSHARHLEMESGLANLCRDFPVSSLCQYGRDAWPDDLLLLAAELHPGGICDEQVTARTEPGIVYVDGAVDSTNDEMLAAALRAAASRARNRLTVDLSRATFLSVSGCRALARGGSEFVARGGEVRVTGAASHLLRTMKLLRLGDLITFEPELEPAL